jgi:hypothetical protein
MPPDAASRSISKRSAMTDPGTMVAYPILNARLQALMPRSAAGLLQAVVGRGVF